MHFETLADSEQPFDKQYMPIQVSSCSCERRSFLQPRRAKAVSGLLFGLMMAPVSARSSAAQFALLAPAEETRLVQLIAKNDAAQSLFGVLKAHADAALDSEPKPIETIRTQHKVAGDPEKTATLSSLKDMRILAALGYAYAVTGRANYAYKAREFIFAWARKNHPTGEPIDETNLEPLIVAYDLTRETFSDGDRKTVDAYLRRIIDAEWSARQVTNNWQSHRLKIVGLAAYVLRDDILIARAIEGYKRQVDANLNPDGSSFDFFKRDALHYHVYDLEPLLTLAIAAQAHGLDLYDYTSNKGASLRKSVNFLIPYCTGEKIHHEFVHSQVEFDRTRAENGQEEYEAGHLFLPEEGFMALCLAEHFDVSLDPVIAKLAGQNRDIMASWRLLLNAASRTK